MERFKIPPNATTPLHTHPNTENITVLAGSFGLAENRTFDKSSGKILTPGSFYLLPPNQAHFAWSGADGAIIQIHGVGPSGMTVLHAPPQESQRSGKMTRPTGADIPNDAPSSDRPRWADAADSARRYILHVTAWGNGEQAVLDPHRQFFEIFPRSRPGDRIELRRLQVRECEGIKRSGSSYSSSNGPAVCAYTACPSAGVAVPPRNQSTAALSAEPDAGRRTRSVRRRRRVLGRGRA